jgi:predicted MFS family arabinose efflux permease
VKDQKSRNATYTLVLLFLVNFLNFFDRTIPAVVLEPIRAEYKLDDTSLGLLGTSFTLTYAFAGIPLGYLSDRFNRKVIIIIGLTIWSLVTGATGLSWSFLSFFFIRLLVGIGEASCAPSANSLIGDLYPSEQRARAVGVFMLGLPLGLVLAFVVVGGLAEAYGWRVPFLFAAVPGFLVAAAMFWVEEPARGAKETYAVTAQNRSFMECCRRVMSIPTVWWIIASGATVNFASYAMSTFLTTMLIRYHHLSVAAAGGVSAIVLGLTGLIGLTLGGALADRLHKKYLRGRILMASLGMFIGAPLVYLGLGQPSGAVTATTILLSLGWLPYFAYFVTVYSSLQDVVAPQLRATAMAVYFFLPIYSRRRLRHDRDRGVVRHVRPQRHDCWGGERNDSGVPRRGAAFGHAVGRAARDAADGYLSAFCRQRLWSRPRQSRRGRVAGPSGAGVTRLAGDAAMDKSRP